jgi:hypothetical protein
LASFAALAALSEAIGPSAFRGFSKLTTEGSETFGAAVGASAEA